MKDIFARIEGGKLCAVRFERECNGFATVFLDTGLTEANREVKLEVLVSLPSALCAVQVLVDDSLCCFLTSFEQPQAGEEDAGPGPVLRSAVQAGLDRNLGN
jgi:hypothetical protein